MWVALVLLVATGAALAVAWLNVRARTRDLYRAERLAEGGEFDLGTEEIACLAGHLAELKLLEMYDAGRIVVSRSGDVTATTPPTGPEDDFEAKAVENLGPTRTGDMAMLLAWVNYGLPAQALRRRLAAQGLLKDRELLGRASTAQAWMSAVPLAVAAAGVAALVYTLVRHENWLFPLLAFPALFGVARWVGSQVEPAGADLDSGNRLGCRVLSEARSADSREDGPTADRREHAPMAVALDGLSALPTGHDLRICLEASRVRIRAGRSNGPLQGGGSYSGKSCGTGGSMGCGAGCGSGCGGA